MTEKPGRDWQNSVETIVQMGHYLNKLKEENQNVNRAKLAVTDFAIDDSAANKVGKIAEHPILSNPENFAKLPASWGKLYELRFLPDDFLKQKLEEDAVLDASKYTIWEWRGVKKRGAPTLGERNNKVIIPDNVSLVAYVSAGMQKEQEFGGECGTAEEVAKILQIGVSTYRMIRSILILARRPELNPADRDLVHSVIDKINKTRNVRTHYEKVKPLIDKIWGSSQTKTLSNKLSQKRVDGYMNSVGILRDMCRAMYEREQPYLPSEDLDTAILDLTEASRIIRALAENLRRTKNE